MKKLFTQTILLVIALLAGTSAKAISYKIDGPSELTTNAVYSIVTTDGSALPVGLTATWDYPSDFYRISYTNTTIQLGRKTAEGYYTLRATLNNGTTLSKSIRAVKPVDPSTKNEITLRIIGINDRLSGTYSDISQYTSASGKSFTTTTGDLYFSCVIEKTSAATSSIIDASNLKIAYGYQNAPYTTSVYQYGTLKESINLSDNRSTEVVIQAPYNWTSGLNNNTISFYFVYTHNAGQQLFNGTYNIINGMSKFKAIESSSAQNIYVQPIEVSRNYYGPYEDIMQYRPYTGKYYYMGGDNLNVKFSIKNKTNQSITFNSNSFEINYGTQNFYNVHSVANESNTIISSFTVPANGTINVIFHLGNEWYDNRENPDYPDLYQPVRLFLYYNGTKTDGISYSYLFTRTNSKSISVYPSTVTSDVIVKSTNDSAIKSIRVVGTMGNLVKSQSYGNNSTEVNLNLSNCQKGIYYIQVEKTTGVETAKIIKK